MNNEASCGYHGETIQEIHDEISRNLEEMQRWLRERREKGYVVNGCKSAPTSLSDNFLKEPSKYDV